MSKSLSQYNRRCIRDVLSERAFGERRRGAAPAHAPAAARPGALPAKLPALGVWPISVVAALI